MFESVQVVGGELEGLDGSGWVFYATAGTVKGAKEAELYARSFQLAHKATHGTAVRADLADKPDFAIATAISHRDRMAILQYAHSDQKVATLDHG